MHRLGMTLSSSSRIEFLCGRKVLFYALTLFEHAGITELCRYQSLAGGALKPARGLFQTGGHAAPPPITHGNFLCGCGVNRRCRVSPPPSPPRPPPALARPRVCPPAP